MWSGLILLQAWKTFLKRDVQSMLHKAYLTFDAEAAPSVAFKKIENLLA